ncbi:Uncharacterised protein [Campylobacter sputorum subsp. bubulus]|uniref:DUF596 domain-containing protein n=1 Tax=Campylobacter sputorum subsp. sputorum TaxID=32024 RepID=A0A381DHJ2_9BACT|nr:hypothetical protein [Campylobacter sputorum]ASM35193.1 hypothetical protein CSPUT_0980 [Campylobacter sputorum aubsp. sputorum RM3237]KAB0581000.1 hypothetical protein F7P64_07735 [Campylobacter sputorum subsp. sputorum]QEL05382.1 hypothetical protein CSPT_0977 [Campylobacter sputorum subsp. sputorum]SUX08808.1 Uncharacterised protein [Campylobacter sputorum subsp. bubulus]SUX10045.1 Uncharacterised protein [Campylobacter sputorum subsp. sputorum]
MNNFTDKQKEIIKRISHNVYKDAYGCWIGIVYHSDYEDFDWLEENELFLAVLKRLLDEGLIVLYPPSDLVKKDEFVSTRMDIDGYGIWDISSNEAIEYIRKHMPLDPDYSDDDTIPYWFGNYCPRIGWVDKDTGKIEMGW